MGGGGGGCDGGDAVGRRSSMFSSGVQLVILNTSVLGTLFLHVRPSS